MRLLVRRIYRAFPELDRFSDEQCARFTLAAGRNWGYRALVALAWGVCLCAAVVMGMGASVLAWRGFEWFVRPRNIGSVELVLAGLGLAAGAAPGIVGAFLLRDVMLRRRIGYVLRARGVCTACRYSLVGLPVGGDGKVVCPECAAETEVDESLGELVIDEKGQARFAPDEQKLGLRTAWLSAERKRLLWTWGLRVVIAGVVVLLGMAGWRVLEDARLQRQATRAAAGRPGVTGLLEVTRRFRSGERGEAAGPDAWTLLGDAALLLQEASAAAVAAAVAAAGPMALDRNGGVNLDFAAVGFEPPRGVDAVGWSDETVEMNRASDALSRRVMEACRRPAILGKLRALTRARSGEAAVSAPGGTPLLEAAAPLWAASQISAFNYARMQTALEAGDAGEFGEALEEVLAISRVLLEQPTKDSAETARADEERAFNVVKRVLMGRVPASGALLGAIEGALERQKLGAVREAAIGAHRVIAQDTVGWVFSDPARVRAGVKSQELWVLGWGWREDGTGERMGGLEENLAAVERVMGAAAKTAPKDWAKLDWEPDLIVARSLLKVFYQSMRSLWRIERMRVNMRVWTAIERYRLEHGAAPESLKEIGEAGLELDPMTGRVLLYKRVDPAMDRLGRGYLLYSTGTDGIDHGGAESFGGGRATGFDEVVNRDE